MLSIGQIISVHRLHGNQVQFPSESMFCKRDLQNVFYDIWLAIANDKFSKSSDCDAICATTNLIGVRCIYATSVVQFDQLNMNVCVWFHFFLQLISL